VLNILVEILRRKILKEEAERRNEGALLKLSSEENKRKS